MEGPVTCVIHTAGTEYVDGWEHTVCQYTSPRLLSECRATFPELPVDTSSVLVVVTMQRTRLDLVSRAPDAEEDKRVLGERFVRVAQRVRQWLRALPDCWADGADPATGYPLEGPRGGITHNDLETVQRCLRYPNAPVGSCYVTEHPRWATRCYPAVLFAVAPAEALWNALRGALALEGAEWDKSPRTSMTGIFVAPPRALWAAANAIREQHYDNLRLGPHVSVVDPFIAAPQLHRACDVLRAHLASVPAFRVRLARLDVLRHNPRSATVYAVPESDPPGALDVLSRALVHCFPQCDDLVRRGGGALTAHVSLAKAGGEADARRVLDALSREWVPLEFDVSHVLLLQRHAALGTSQPFSFHACIALRGPAAVPPFGPGSLEHTATHAASRHVVLFARFLVEGARPLHNGPRGERCEALLEFPNHEEAAAFVAAHAGRCALHRDVLWP